MPPFRIGNSQRSIRSFQMDANYKPADKIDQMKGFLHGESVPAKRKSEGLRDWGIEGLRD
ncbi:MAG TPA: hypothetical protein HPP81_03405 [Deltaproteobacteria bacterium]|jgi:hypothetical protein|nr:hypothetical protein [Deltaproteobacteria bacterium]